MTGWTLAILLHLPGGDDPVRLELAERFATRAECIAAEPAVYDALMPPDGIAMEARCEPPFVPIPRFKPER